MPRIPRTVQNQSLLTAALEGLELQRQRIDEQIREVKAMLGRTNGRRGRPPAAVAVARKRGPGRLSAAARKRIAAAQKRRWAEYRKSAGSGKAE